MWTVYIHKVPNGKVYVGVTSKTLTERWGKHGEGYEGQLFGKAIKKYGWENVEHEVLATTESKEEAERLECYYIRKYNSNDTNFGYNRASGGYVNSGFTFSHTEEAKIKIGNASRGRKYTDEQRERFSESQKGKIISEEQKERLRQIALSMPDKQKNMIAESVKRRWEEGAYDTREGNFHKGHTPWNKGLTAATDERLKSLSVRRKGWVPSEETRMKMSESRKGKLPWNTTAIYCVETGRKYKSIQDAYRDTGINNISSVVDKPNKTAGKCHWRKLDENNNNGNT